MGKFILFAALSAFGWLCDLLTFSLLGNVGIPPFPANFASSYVGVTFVWFTSLKSVFGRSGPQHNRYIVIYWAFQFISILIYSQILSAVVYLLGHANFPILQNGHLALAAKFIITPFNLGTNFLFMKFLTRLMHKPKLH
ncbi:GtrA family protein [Cupriavidus necator]